MKINSIFLLLGASMASAWMSKSPTSRSPASLKLSTAVSSSSFTKPERVVLGELPTLYVYDHCPFCVRVRVALGVKNIKHNLHFLANDDIPTPTKLVGKKIAPIFVSSKRYATKFLLFDSY